MKRTQRVPAGLVILAVMFIAACSQATGNGDGGLPVLPSYTLKSIPAGTVNVDTDYNGATDGNGTGPFSNASSTNVPIGAFKIGETEVTYELWNAVKTWATDPARGGKVYTFANPGRQGGKDESTGPVGNARHPVTAISWRDTVVWCNAYSEASGKTPYYYLEGTSNFTDGTKILRESEGENTAAGNGKAEKAVFNASSNGFRLPKEAEWEYAARGGVPSASTPWTYTYAGSNAINDVAVYNTNQTAEVKTKSANTAGLYDMSGNVAEWCQDIDSGSDRVTRGGHWSNNNATVCVVANRGGGSLFYGYYVIGFRVVSP